ncbi:transcriptional regulator (plasmid) [Priestia aryabhattai]
MFDFSYQSSYYGNVKDVLLLAKKELINVNNRIKELRKGKKMSQEELANTCNVSRQTVNAVEKSKYDPSLELAFRLAEHLGVSVDELFLYKGQEE